MFNTYFSARYVLSKNTIFSIVFSDRSDGKTFDCKARALLDFEKDGSITIYMRRYKSEISKKMYDNFFGEVLEIEEYKRFDKWAFRGSKQGIEVKTSVESDWQFIIYFVPLSIAGKIKSQISDVLKIKTIDFDEYMPLDGKFLKNEVDLLLEFWKTIDRDREIVQLIILGNRITPFNPLFDYFGIDLEISKDKLRLYRNNTLAVQIYSNKEHREKRDKGKFRDLINGTPYEDYDKGGILNALDLKLSNKNGYEYLCSFKSERGEGSIWYNSGKMLISETIRNDGYVITDKLYNLNRKIYLCTYGRFGENFKKIYRSGNMFFESKKAFYIFEKILTKIGSM